MELTVQRESMDQKVIQEREEMLVYLEVVVKQEIKEV